MRRDLSRPDGLANSSLYNPRPFAEPGRDLAFDLMERHSFATLASLRDDAPMFSHLPFLVDRSSPPHGVLLAHMARANPQWRDFKGDAQVTVVFHGPHAYVSPRWYQPRPDNVPTWNYAVVHARGVAKVIQDEGMAFEAMRRLVQHHDPEWLLELPAGERRAMMSAIVVFEVQVARLDAKFKLSQNRSEADQWNVVRHLSHGMTEAERATAEWMRKTRSQS